MGIFSILFSVHHNPGVIRTHVIGVHEKQIEKNANWTLLGFI